MRSSLCNNAVKMKRANFLRIYSENRFVKVELLRKPLFSVFHQPSSSSIARLTLPCFAAVVVLFFPKFKASSIVSGSLLQQKRTFEFEFKNVNCDGQTVVYSVQTILFYVASSC